MAVKPEITLVWIGRKTDLFVGQGVCHYTALLKKWCTPSLVCLKNHNSEPMVTQRRKETDEAIAYLSRRKDRKILLEQGGKSLNSEQFALFIGNCLLDTKNILFLVGGINGFDGDIRQAVHDRLSLSPLTFSHQIAQLVLMEQIFRAFSILYKTSYHR